MDQHRYRLGGLELRSEFKLPLPQCASGLIPTQAVVQVRLGTAAPLPEPRVKRVLIEVAPEDYWLDIPNIARYRVRAGTEIVVQAAAGAPAAAVSAYLCSYALAALCCQRGLLVVHATALALRERAVLLVGPSGCGKSTLGAALAARGAELLSDGLCVIDASSAVALVHPCADRLTLWSDVVEQLGVKLDATQLIETVPKFAVEVGPPALAPVPVHCVLALHAAHARQTEIRLEPLPLLQVLASLAAGASLSALLTGMNRQRAHLQQCRQLLLQAPALQLVRRLSFDELPRMAQLVERLIATDASNVGAVRTG